MTCNSGHSLRNLDQLDERRNIHERYVSVPNKFLLTTLILEGISHAASKAKELVGWSDNAI